MVREPTDTNDTAPPQDVSVDDWPIDGYEEREQAEYLGTMSPKGDRGSTAVIYDQRAETVFEADIDEEEEQFVLREDTGRELGSSETLGETLEDFGERIGWVSLSDFAQDRLQDYDEEEQEALSPDTVTFTQSNVRADSDHDMEFSGSSTYRTTDDRVILLERTFKVRLDDRNNPKEATIDVIEQVLRAEEPAEDRRTGDADPLQERESTFEIDLNSIEADLQIESTIKERCQEWHESHLESPV